jgi:SAM-dependent methyltransferase
MTATPVPIPVPVCPLCRSALRDAPPSAPRSGIPDASGAASAVCTACGEVFPRLYGILDLRPDRSATEWDEADRKTAGVLAARFPDLSYAGLVDLQQSRRGEAEVHGMDAHYRGYLLVQEERSRLMVSGFHDRLDAFFPEGKRGAALDLGCGSGAGLPALAGRYGAVAGLEPGLANLILAKKALESVPGGAAVTLVRGVAQAVPFADGTFDYVQMQNVIEHVIDADGAVSETRRVLAPGGRFAADSRNRHDVFRREPHVHLRGVGFLPVRWQKPYVWLRRRIRYEQTRLWSLGELRRILKRHFGRDFRIAYPLMTAYGQTARQERWVLRVERIPLLGRMLLRVFPSHWIAAKK